MLSRYDATSRQSQDNVEQTLVFKQTEYDDRIIYYSIPLVEKELPFHL